MNKNPPPISIIYNLLLFLYIIVEVLYFYHNKYKIRKNEKLVRNNIACYGKFWDSWVDKFLDSKTEGMVMGVLVCRDCGWFAGKQHLKNPSDFPYKFKNR